MSEAATTVRLPAQGEPRVTDGPFLEGREDIGGCATIDVPDLDAALAELLRAPGRNAEARAAGERALALVANVAERPPLERRLAEAAHASAAAADTRPARPR